MLPPVPPAAQAGELGAYVQQLLGIIAQLTREVSQLTQEVAHLRTENQALRDEVSVLKGLKKRPVFKGSNLDKRTDDDDEPPGAKRPGSSKRSKTAQLTVHEQRILKPAESVPPGSTFKGYRDFTVQELVIRAHNTLFRRKRWVTPDGRTLNGVLPTGYDGGHFGPQLRAYVLYQHHHCHVTQPKLREQLLEWGVTLSAAELDTLLAGGHEALHAEKQAVLTAGLRASSVVTVDDTGARHAGANAVSTVVSGPTFAVIETGHSKSRIAFLELLHAGAPRYCINDAALRYMAEHGLDAARVARLRGARGEGDKAVFERLLARFEVSSVEHRRLVTEGALWGALAPKVHPGLAVVSDGAGQFDVGTHGLCWVHSERLVLQLVPGCEAHRTEQARVRGELWALYAGLKVYRRAPAAETASVLEAEFDRLFTQHTGFEALDAQLSRLYARKDELLLVLRRPEVPLHTNQSETDIRDCVKKRKVSGGTRSERGRQCRDTFTSLMKTCRKLKVSFWQFLIDRLSHTHCIPSLGELVLARAA